MESHPCSNSSLPKTGRLLNTGLHLMQATASGTFGICAISTTPAHPFAALPATCLPSFCRLISRAVITYTSPISGRQYTAGALSGEVLEGDAASIRGRVSDIPRPHGL